MGLGGVELVGGQQVVHGVAPAAPLHEPHCGPTGSVDASQRLMLAEPAVVGRDHDVAGQHQLDTQGVRVALDRADHRLGTHRAQCSRIGAGPVAAAPVTSLHAGGELREIQPGGEVVAVGEQHAAPQVVVAVEAGVGVDQHVHHLRGEAVEFGGPVDPDQ